MIAATDGSDQKWNKEFARQHTRDYPKWPNEVMVKTLFGGSNYLRHPYTPSPDWRVLDVGCGFANNLVPFAQIGCECHGVDLHQGIADRAGAIMTERGYDAEFAVGSNRALPYPDGHFDLVLSINTLHYEGTEANISAALAEFHRILKPGGAVYISTVGPKHEIARRAAPLGNHRFCIQNFDFRNGEEFFFFETEAFLEEKCASVFVDVETGNVTEKLFKFPLDFLLAVAHKADA